MHLSSWWESDECISMCGLVMSTCECLGQVEVMSVFVRVG